MLETPNTELVVSEACFPLIALAMSPMPVNVMLLDALKVDAATEFTLTALLVVNVFCFAPTAADISVMMSVPPKYRGPVMRAELPQIKEPDTSKDGAVTGAENTALLAEIPSRSTLLLSAKLNVPDAGLIRAHVRVPNVTKDELDKTPCFAANCAVKSVTSAIAIGPDDACA